MVLGTGAKIRTRMALIVTIKVVPGSGKQLWKFDSGGTLKCYLKNQAEKGLANKELIETLSKKLGLPQTTIHIIKGASARTKIIKIEHNLSLQDLYRYLEIQEPAIQQKLF